MSTEEKKQLAARRRGEHQARARAQARRRDSTGLASRSQSVYEIRDFIEFKTTWHPIGA